MEQSQSSQAERRRLISGGRKLRPRGHIWFGDVGHKGYSGCAAELASKTNGGEWFPPPTPLPTLSLSIIL